MGLPWEERISMLSINPDAASRDDVARLASELMEANKTISWLDKREEYSNNPRKDGGE